MTPLQSLVIDPMTPGWKKWLAGLIPGLSVCQHVLMLRLHVCMGFFLSIGLTQSLTPLDPKLVLQRPLL